MSTTTPTGPTATREIHLAARPQGWPDADDFALVETELAAPGPGEVLVRTTWMSVDPYMRGRMSDAPSYVAPFEVGQPLDGAAVGEVLAVGDGVAEGGRVAVGDTVLHGLGWREHALVPAEQVRRLDVSDDVPARAYLGVLGAPGLTAYVGLRTIAALREGETVWVSAAAGAVGSAVGQMARQMGAARVIGSAGGPEKCRWLVDELGFDAAVDYREDDLLGQLRAAAPDGVDVYFDNVGGDHLEAALEVLNDFGRIAACGAISGYNDDEPAPGPRNLMQVVKKRIDLHGFIVSDHGDVRPDFYRDALGWVADGALRWQETVVEGLDRAPEAFLDLLRGGNTGKMLVKLAD